MYNVDLYKKSMTFLLNNDDMSLLASVLYPPGSIIQSELLIPVTSMVYQNLIVLDVHKWLSVNQKDLKCNTVTIKFFLQYKKLSSAF